MAIDLYYLNLSTTCRAVLMTMKHLGIPVNIKVVNLMQKEQFHPDFVQINPQHCLPTIVDDGYVLWESRVIMQYLANKYAPGDPIYPSEPIKRALVEKMLYFDMGTLYQAVKDYSFPIIKSKEPSEPEKEEKMKIALTFLEGFLTSSKFVAGDVVTIADLSILATLTLLDVLEYDITGYKRVYSWKNKLQTELKYFKEVNEAGIAAFKAIKNK